jgi:hypothetical protein
MRVAVTVLMAFTVILRVRLGMRLAKTPLCIRRVRGFRCIGMRFRRGFTGRARLLAGRRRIRTRACIRPGMAAIRLVTVRLPRRLDAAKRPAKIVELTLVCKFLAFSNFD